VQWHWPRYYGLQRDRDFDEFVGRVETHFKRLDAAQIKYARSIYDPVITSARMPGDTSLRVKVSTQITGLDIYYTFDTTNPDRFSHKYNGVPLAIPNGAGEIKVITYRNNKPIGKQIDVMLKNLPRRKN